MALDSTVPPFEEKEKEKLISVFSDPLRCCSREELYATQLRKKQKGERKLTGKKRTERD